MLSNEILIKDAMEVITIFPHKLKGLVKYVKIQVIRQGK